MESAPRSPHPHTPSDYYEQVSNERHTHTLSATKDRSGHEQTFPICLFTCAGHVVVPVHKRALRVVPPGPDVELEERRNIEAIRGVDEVEDLLVEYRRRVVIGGEPGRRVQDELDAYEGHLAIGGLVDEGLRLRGVEGEITEQGGVDVVHAHRPVIGTGNATKKRSVAGFSGIVNVKVLPRASAHLFNKRARRGLFVNGLPVLGIGG